MTPFVHSSAIADDKKNVFVVGWGVCGYGYSLRVMLLSCGAKPLLLGFSDFF